MSIAAQNAAIDRALDRRNPGTLATFSVETIGYRFEPVRSESLWRGERTVERRVVVTAITVTRRLP